MTDSKASVRAYALLAGAQLAVGAAAIFARWALTGAGPLSVSALRLTIAAAAVWALAAMRRKATHVSPEFRTRLAIAGVALAAHFGTWIASLQYTTVAISTLLVSTTPLWTAMYDAVVRKRPMRARVWPAYALAGLGLLMVVGIGGSAPPIPGHALLGAALAIAGSISIGAYFEIVRSMRADVSTRDVVQQTYGWAAIVLIVAAVVARQAPPPLEDGTAWAGIVAMALVSQLLGHTAMNASLRRFSPTAVAMTTLLEPVVAALLALAIFGERLLPLALLGGVVLLAAVAAVLREEAR
ncbi:MAG: EamA family transporter [Candidatus Eremiobacteraeota bacterium]|nr:EamA family transporter [Candidatus Eremiobacteraeota bacterium]